MVAEVNFIVLLLASLLTVVFYIMSASPAALEKRIGEKAYTRCSRNRIASGLFMTLAGVNYVVYAFHPLQFPIPREFPWPYWVSALIAVFIGIPSGYLWVRGSIDAGEETMIVKKEHQMYGGIYKKIRHPQAAGEVWFWWVIAFLCNSPFLAIYSLIWLPLFHIMSRAEERDLVLRYGKDYELYMKSTGMYFPKR
jgi:protein-S-isoprenylcysteine O-methyltransferase Ste14